MKPVDDAFSRHSKVAFQFSGGKDSLALLLEMEPYWDRMTVYHVDTGDQHPDLSAVVEKMRERVPITTINGNVSSVKEQFGPPSDVVPWSSSEVAHWANVGITLRIQDRVLCCVRTIMIPLHDAMVRDGVTLIVRAQKNDDLLKGPFKNGDVYDGFEFLYPFEDYSDADCFAVLKKHGISAGAYYDEGLSHTGDCMGCTAFTHERGRARHLREFHPERYAKYRDDMLTIAALVEPITDQISAIADECMLYRC